MGARDGDAQRTHTGRIGRRGVIVIPADLRRELGLEEGTPILAESRDGGVLIRSAAVELLTDRERQELLEAANVAYAALRGEPEAWAAEQVERAAWQRLSAETLPREIWTDDDLEVQG
ncbi:MAG: AbrB/MazE/SpoVT family DNA-binding domain-containing protein [Dehalococcoidia bacterium]